MKTILFLAANPINTPSLQLDKELREVKEGLRRSKKSDEFILKSSEATRPIDIQRAMLDHKPSFVHFSGHSNSDGIFLLNREDKASFVTTDALAELFNLFSDKVECVILNSCYSEKQAKAISKNIPYVIGMTSSIEDKVAIDFATSFYDAIGAGENIEFAYKLGCNAIQLYSESTLEKPTPMLHAKNDVNTTANMGSLLENSNFKNKVSIIDKKIRSVVNPATNTHKELIDWVLKTVESQGDRIANKVIEEFRDTTIKIPKSDDDIENYLFDMSKFLNRVCYSMAHDNRSVISTPRISTKLNLNTYDTKLYKKFFNELLNGASSNGFPKESLNKFATSSEYLLNNIF